MPYIITTSHREMLGKFGAMDAEVSRRAVATLEEARREAVIYIERESMGSRANWADAHQNALTLPAEGGTVGPLPDGTVIEVAPTTWEALMSANGMRERGPTTDEIIAAYNARA